MATSTSVTIPPAAPKAPAVQPFVQKTHDDVVGFLGAFDITQLTDASKTHTEKTSIKTPNAIAAVFFAAVTAYAYKAANKYVALGLGALAVVSLVTGFHKKLVVSKEFKTFSDGCDAVVTHLTNAFASKANFMIDQVGVAENGWKIHHDRRLSKAYDDPNSTEKLDASKITEVQKAWRAVHTPLVQAAVALNLSQNAKNSSHLNAVLAKVSKASDLVQHGQSPRATEPKNQTYVQYMQDRTAAVWPTTV